MITMPDLQTALLDLLHEIRTDDLKLIVGGGYGIYLKREHIRTTAARTLYEEWPEARSTNDLDFFLRPELLIESNRLEPLADALDRLGYTPVAGAEHYQFAKLGPTGGAEGSVKIDLLTGPRSSFDDTAVRTDERRARPAPSVGVHAHPTDEAITLEAGLLAVRIDGKTSDGIDQSVEVYLPHPMTFSMMKLFAFRDQREDPVKDMGRHHALDVYAVFATTTEAEWEQGLSLRDHTRDDPQFREAAEIVDQFFSSPTSVGILRMKENPYFRRELQIADFIRDITELFPKNN